MYRKDLIELLHGHPMTLHEIAKLLGLKSRDVEDDLHHLQRTLHHGPFRLVIHPARCHKCGFLFSTEHFHKPGKCPRCKGTWIVEPRFETCQQR
jgi:predicted Zn-ribbon and HTH transcriptional regulator